MIREKDVDKMLEICFNAVERMASHLEDQSAALNDIETDSNELPLNKMLHTLGATVGNFLYAYQSVMGEPELIEAFNAGLRDYIKYCQQEDSSESESRPTRLIDWVVDNSAYKN